jgi:hypothetical protein
MKLAIIILSVLISPWIIGVVLNLFIRSFEKHPRK